MNFIDELTWRGFLDNSTPDIKNHFKEPRTAYIGFDPTSDSLHVGNLIQILLLMHLQRHGHIPIALIGGATGMVGDPSGKKNERKLLDYQHIQNNFEGVKKTLERFIKPSSKAKIVNNNDWISKLNFISFIRDIGKHITISYLLAKDSIKSRINTGLSFTEFSYQLIQAYDFYYLLEHHNCTVQLGGSDQWGNITSGIELIKKKTSKDAFAATSILVKKADGSKFGKSESGNIWLDKSKTSTYKFYQFWLNVSDSEAEDYIKLFTFLNQETINTLITSHKETPHHRLLQKKLAEEVTILVHSKKDLQDALIASEVLFSKHKDVIEQLNEIKESSFREIFSEIGSNSIPKNLVKGLTVSDLLANHSSLFNSKGEVVRMMKSGGGVSINKQPISNPNTPIIESDFIIHNKFLLAQKGKKNYFLFELI